VLRWVPALIVRKMMSRLQLYMQREPQTHKKKKKKKKDKEKQKPKKKKTTQTKHQAYKAKCQGCPAREEEVFPPCGECFNEMPTPSVREVIIIKEPAELRTGEN